MLRVASARVPLDPEDRRMAWGALHAPAGCARAQRLRPGAHPHALPRPLRRRALARGAPASRVATYHTFFEEYLHHYVPLLPRPLGPLLRAQLHPLAVRGGAGADRPVRADARGAAPRTACARRSTCCPRDCLPIASARGRRGISPQRRHRCRAARSDLHRPRRAREEHRLPDAGASARCCRRVPQAMLVIAGEGPARESLRAQVAIARSCRPACTSPATSSATPELLDCYAAADAFVFASRTETQGLVLLEALAQGAAGGLDRRARHALGAHARQRRAGRARGSRPCSPPRWCGC